MLKQASGQSILALLTFTPKPAILLLLMQMLKYPYWYIRIEPTNGEVFFKTPFKKYEADLYGRRSLVPLAQ